MARLFTETSADSKDINIKKKTTLVIKMLTRRQHGLTQTDRDRFGLRKRQAESDKLNEISANAEVGTGQIDG